MRIAFLHPGRAFKAAAEGLTGRGHETFLLNGVFRRGGSWLIAAFRLKRILRENSAEVVFVTTNRDHLIAAVARFLGSHAQVVRRIPAGSQLALSSAGKWAMRFTRTVFLFSNEGDERSVPLPKRAAGVVVAKVGVDVNEYSRDSASAYTNPCIICICDHPGVRRHLPKAVRMLAMLASRHPNLRLITVGAGADNDDVRMQAAALNVLHMVTFLGEDVRGELSRSPCLGWIACDGDAAAFAVLDLMAIGVPVIANEDTVAEKYVAHNISGVLLPEDDENLAAATVAELLSNEHERTKMGHAARVRVERDFPESKMIDGFERAASYAVERSERNY